MGKAARRKGAEGEREAADMLRAVYPSARRRCSGEESQDAIQGRDIAGTPGLCVQVQVAGRVTPDVKLREAIQAAGANEVPIAMVCRRSPRRRDGMWFVVMRPGDFIAAMLAIGAVEIPEADKGKPLPCWCGREPSCDAADFHVWIRCRHSNGGKNGDFSDGPQFYHEFRADGRTYEEARAAWDSAMASTHARVAGPTVPPREGDKP